MSQINRSAWLKKKRRIAEERMDKLFAPVYDQQWGAKIDPTHGVYLEHFLMLCPPGGLILDAACGTGKYWPVLLEHGRRFRGIDQSAEMLACAHKKFPMAPHEKLSLQEIAYHETFSGLMCIDAMENVPPEDWPLVLVNFWNALRQNGILYITVETIGEDELQESYTAARQLGLPVVYGEVESSNGYHYYPVLERVRGWLWSAGFVPIKEGEGDGYRHFLARKPRLGTNLLNLDADERAISLAP